VDILKYKDYEGTAELDMARGVCRGKILFINDLVTYEASQPSELQKEFEAAVDDYVETCAELGREPQKSLKGQFNVRISQELHKASTLRALSDGVSLNDVVVKALDAYINARVDINHVETKNYFVGYGEFQNAFASASSPHNQEVAYGHLAFATEAVAASNVQMLIPVGGQRAARH
jgi:predicted HicB family RNase H-like nuclease